MGSREVREVLASGKVVVAGEVVREGNYQVGAFDRVEVGGKVVQARVRRRVKLHKPLGVVSATVDAEHGTVIDLIEEPWAGELHLAGRLDRFTSGLVVLTNDSGYSEGLTLPGKGVGKRYVVEVDGKITGEMVAGFEEGIWFEKEGVRTESAVVELLGEKRCRLTIFEGKHHQVKRMFARFGVKVTGLHREAIGEVELGDLKIGEWEEF